MDEDKVRSSAGRNNDVRTTSVSLDMSDTCVMVATGVPCAASKFFMNVAQYAPFSLTLGFGLPEYRDTEICAAGVHGNVVTIANAR